MKLDIEPYDKGVAKRLDNTTTKKETQKKNKKYETTITYMKIRYL